MISRLRAARAGRDTWELAGARLAAVVDFEEMFNLLVKPEKGFV